MSHTRLWISAAIIAIVIFVGFVLSVPHTRDVAQTPTDTEIKNTPAVTLHDVFKKGTHTITGSVEAPNACTEVTATVVAVGDASTTESVLINISMTKDTGVCLQLPTQKDFSTTIAAPAHVPLSATVNGEEATTTIL